jgi:anti-sigma factor RsiW
VLDSVWLSCVAREETMNVNRNVVTDLLPIYLSGEAHEDTRSLVEEYLANDSEFARMVDQSRVDAGRRHPQPSVALSDAGEAALLARTRSAIRRAIWLRALLLWSVAVLLAVAGVWTRMRFDLPALARWVRVASDTGQILLALILLVMAIQFYRRRS